VTRSADVEIAICRDCGEEVQQRGRNTWKCVGCGAEWDLEHEPHRWQFGQQVERVGVDDGTGWEHPDGHTSPPRAQPDIGFVAAAGWTAGGAFGVVLAALTSPVTAVLLVGAMVALAAGSLRLFREVMA
jgi:hypothetical protein